MAKRILPDAERRGILLRNLESSAGPVGSATSSPRVDGAALSMQEFTAAMERARVADDSGSPLATEYGVTVTSGASLDEAKDVARDSLSKSFASALSQWGHSATGEESAVAFAVADKLVDSAFDSGFRSIDVEQANMALDGLHQGVATAALSLAVNDLQGAQKGAGPAALAANNSEATLQTLELVTARMGETRLAGVQSVEGLQPTLLALAELEVPTPGQVHALRSVEELEFKATAAFSRHDASSEFLAEFAQEVRDLSASVKLAFGEKADALGTALESFAKAVEEGDVGQAQTSFAEALQGGRDLATRALSDFVSSGAPALSEAQSRLDDFAPTAADGMGRFVVLVNDSVRDSEDVGGTFAAVHANLAAVMDAARERGDGFLSDLESLSSYRESALVALAERTMAAQARQEVVSGRQSAEVGWTPFEDSLDQQPAVEGSAQEPDRRDSHEEMEMAL